MRAAIATLLLAPAPPLLFMGEEFGAVQPFLFFCDFAPELAAAVAQGRRREFTRLAVAVGPDGTIPDPNDPATFQRCKLDWRSLEQAPQRDWLALHRQLLHLRQQQISPRLAGMSAAPANFTLLQEQGLQVNWTLGDGTLLSLLGNYSWQPLWGVAAPPGSLLYASSRNLEEMLKQGCLPPWSVAWFLR